MAESPEAVQLREACMLVCPDPKGKVKIGKDANKDHLEYTLKRIGFDYLTAEEEIEKIRETLQEGNSPGESTLT